MAEFKWTKGNRPKESGEYIITFKESDDTYWVSTDTYNSMLEEWSYYEDAITTVVAYSPLPKPFRPRNRKNGNKRKSNNRKTSK